MSVCCAIADANSTETPHGTARLCTAAASDNRSVFQQQQQRASEQAVCMCSLRLRQSTAGGMYLNSGSALVRAHTLCTMLLCG